MSIRIDRTLRRMLAPAALAMLAICAATVAQGPEPPDWLVSGGVDAARVRELQRARAAVLGEADPRRRTELLELLAKTQRRLWTAHPTDPRRGIWLADYAEDLLLGVAPARGLDLTCLFGWPTNDELADARTLARRALAAVREATEFSAALMATIDAETSGDLDAVAERFRSHLVERELGARLPALEGLAAGLLSLVDDDDAAQWRQRAVARLWPVLIELEGTPRRTARAHLTLALAGLGRRDEAASMLRAMTADGTPDAVDRLWSTLTSIEAIHLLDGPRAALERLNAVETAVAERPDDASATLRRDPFVRILHTDMRARLLDAARDRQPLRPYADLLASLPAAERQRMRSLVLERLAGRAPDSAVPGDRVPDDREPLVTVAIARRELSRGADMSSWAATLQTIRNDQRLVPAERTAAAVVLIDALAEAGRSAEMAQACLDLARLMSGEPEARDAIERGAEVALRQWRIAPASDTASLLAATLDTLVARYPTLPSIERWRHESARLALAEGRRDDLLAIRDATPADSVWRGETELLLAIAARQAQDAIDKESDAASNHGRWTSLQAQVERSLALLAEAPAAEARPGADDWVIARSALAPTQARILLAESQLALGRPAEASDLLDLVDPEPLPPALVAELLRLRIAAFQARGLADRAEREIDRLVSAVPDRAWRAIAAVLSERLASIEQLRDRMRDAEADEIAARDLAPLAAALNRLLAADAVEDLTPATRVLLRRHVAEALLAVGDLEAALEGLDALADLQPDSLEILLARAFALERLGGTERLAEAMTLFKRISIGRADAGDSAFWAAETAMLRILLTVGRGGGQVGPRIEQLRRRDPDLGGDRWRRQLEGLARQASLSG